MSCESGFSGASQVALAVKNHSAKAGGTRDLGSIPGSRRSPGGGQGNPLQNSCLENPTDRGAWWATVQRVPKSQTQLKRLSMHASRRTFPSEMWAWHFEPVSSSLRFPVCGSTWGVSLWASNCFLELWAVRLCFVHLPRVHDMRVWKREPFFLEQKMHGEEASRR